MTSTAPQRIVSPDDFSSIPSILSWFVAVAGVLSVVAKIATKLARTQVVVIDDILIIVSLVFSIGLTVSVAVESSNGLGKHETSLSNDQLLGFQKSAYAVDLLLILTLFFSKSSILSLLQSLSPSKTDRIVIYSLGGAIFMWVFTSFFAAAFQCPLPQAWMVLNSKCFDQNAFWTYFGVLNICSEVLLIVVPAIFMSRVQISPSRRATITVVFALRVFVIGAVIAELYFRHRAAQSADKTFAQWPVVVCVLFVQCLSIICSCVPHLRPFFSSLQSGMIRVDDTRRFGDGTTMGRSNLENQRSRNGIMKSDITLKNTQSKQYRPWPLATAGDDSSGSERHKHGEGGSMSSTAKIIRTTSFHVVSEEAKERDHERKPEFEPVQSSV